MVHVKKFNMEVGNFAQPNLDYKGKVGGGVAELKGREGAGRGGRVFEGEGWANYDPVKLITYCQSMKVQFTSIAAFRCSHFAPKFWGKKGDISVYLVNTSNSKKALLLNKKYSIPAFRKGPVKECKLTEEFY